MKIYPSGTLISNRYEVVQGPHEKPSLLGGMGIVYLCLDRQEDRPVALKTFQPQFLPDRVARDRFLREGTTWVNLGRHPHIVHCYGADHVNHGQEVFLILEQIAADPAHSGASLRDWLQPGQPLSLDSALLICLQIVRGLAHAVDTQPGFVHRDLKPENVLVGADTLPDWPVNRVRVTDFGLVASLGQIALPANSDPASDPTALERTQLTRGWLGTPLYMAPEQWKGEAVTSATDIYALGLILIEMISGQKAMAASTLSGLKQAHLTGQLQPLPAGLPEEVTDLISSCVAAEPADRFQSWAEVETAMAQVYQVVSAGAALPSAVAAASLNRAERIAQGWAMNSLGGSYLDIGKSQVAVDYFEQVLALGKREGELGLRAAGLGNLGNAYRQLGDVHRAISYYEQHLTLSLEMGDRGSEADSLGNLGIAYFQLGDVRQSISYQEQTLIIAQKMGDRNREGSALNELGIAYFQLGDIRRSISHHEQNLAIAQGTGNKVSEGKALGNLGNAYYQLGDVRRSISCHEQHLAIAQGTGDRIGEGTAFGNLGLAYYKLGDIRRAISYHGQSLTIAQEVSDRVGVGRALGNLGLAYKKLGNTLYAISYFEQTQDIAQEIGDIFVLAIALLNLAMLQAEQGNISKALSQAQEAADIFTRVGHRENAQQAQQLVAQLQSVGAASSGPTPAQILENFNPLMAAVVTAAQGNTAARTQVEAAFAPLSQKGWQIADPIKRIWNGERDSDTLTAGLDENEAVIIQEILRQL